MLDDNTYTQIARDTLQAFEAEVEQFPWCFAGLLGSVVWARCGGKGIVIVESGDSNKAATTAETILPTVAPIQTPSASEAHTPPPPSSPSQPQTQPSLPNDHNILQALRQTPNVARTIVKLGPRPQTGAWLRQRNPLLASFDPAKQGVWICEDRACRMMTGLGDL